MEVSDTINDIYLHKWLFIRILQTLQSAALKIGMQ